MRPLSKLLSRNAPARWQGPTLATLLIFMLMPCSALGKQSNRSATHAYILANYALVRSARSEVKPAEEQVAKLNAQLREECGHVASESPQNHESEQLTDEVAGALWSIVYHLDSRAINRFSSAVAPLRWTDSKLTRRAEKYATSLRELSNLTMPNLCADVRSWTVSSFHTIPTSTTEFVRHLNTIGATTIPSRQLEPYEGSSEKSLAARMDHLETMLEHAESSIGFNDWSTLLETLGLNQ
jgi:hypothetical protein